MSIFKRFRGGAFGIIVAVVSVSATVFLLPGLGGGFLFDDRPNIIQNAALHLGNISSLNDLLYAAYSFEAGGSSRPLAMLSFALDFLRSGLDPVAFKVTNLIIHGLTCFVLALFFRQLFVLASWPPQRAAQIALLLALLWAIHPLQVSSVLYIVQRMQTLATFFVLLALLAYMQMRRRQIEGLNSRLYGILTILCGVLAFACKEDAVLLPLYFLVLELTILQFRAARPEMARRLRLGYGTLTLLGVVVFLFVIVPHYWHWDAYPRRDFSTLERLLTQGRVLVMYLGQIVFPHPDRMTFIYDTMVVSRSLWSPWTTLPSIFLIVVLLTWAGYWRFRRPLFSLGVLLFFSGHFITSNVINLELAFEHRNHFPLIGIVLALGDLAAAAWMRCGFPWRLMAVSIVSIIGLVGSATLFRAYVWGDEIRLAKHHVRVLPNSERAWLILCTTHFELSNQRDSNSHLDLAINTCEKGAEHLSQSAILLSNVVIYKAVKGTVTDGDWQRFLASLRDAPMNVQNKSILWATILNAETGTLTNEGGVLETINLIANKAPLNAAESLRVAAYIFNETHEPIQAFSHLKRAVELSPPGDPAIQKMLDELAAAGRQDWVDRLMQVEQYPVRDELL